MLSRLLLLVLLVPTPLLYAQRDEAALSEAEIEQLRDSAYVANDRVNVFIKLIDTRIKAIQDLYSKPRHPGREEDTHNLLEQFTAIADELNDNLDDYGPHRRDIRKSLPKLVDATERWATVIKTPPDDPTYNVSRKLALEAVHDLREDATELIEQQRAWFAAHPPAKENPENVQTNPR
jgi:hypothetical protein